MLWLTDEWWRGFGEQPVDTELAQPMQGSAFQVSMPAIEALGWLDMDGIRIELLADGRPLGPRLSDFLQVGGPGRRGAFCLEPAERSLLSSHHSHEQILRFSAPDGGDVRDDGRTYTLRWYRRGDPNALLVVVVSWIGLVALAARSLLWAPPARPPSGPSTPPTWALGLPVAAFTLFALFGARGSAAQSWPWICGLALCTLPALGWRRASRPSGRWWSWLLALLGLAAATTLASRLYASTAVLADLMIGVAVGCLGFLALRHGVRAVGTERRSMARALAWAAAITAVVLFWRQAGFRIAASLALASPLIHSGPWQDKFSENWLLVLFWSAMALASPRDFGLARRSGAAGALVAFSLCLGSTLTLKLVSLLTAATFCLAWQWPSAARRAVVGVTVAVVLGAPWIAAATWRASLESEDGQRMEVDRRRLARRAGIWEYSRQLTWRRPLIGEGLGASRRLPGSDIPVAELIPVPGGSLAAGVAGKPALAGGHPHNFALQVWLELGPVGALLLAGLMVTGLGFAGRQRSGNEQTAARLAVYLAVTAFLFANYPLWSPSVVCLVLFAAGGASILRTDRRPEVSRSRSCRRLVPWCLLAMALVTMAIEKAQRWQTVALYRQGSVVLPATGGSVRIGGRERRLVDRAIGEVEVLPEAVPGSLLIKGWGIERSLTEAVDHVVVFYDELAAAVAWTGRPTPEIHRATSKEHLSTLFAGFETRIGCRRPCRAEAVRVLLISRDGAASLASPAPDAEPADEVLQENLASAIRQTAAL